MHVWNFMMKQSHYTYRHVSGVGMGAALLQPEAVQAAQEIQHKTTAYSGMSHLWARAYQAQKKIDQHRNIDNRYTKQAAKEVGIITNHKQLVAIFNTETTMNSTQITPALSQNIIQTWTRSIHSRLAVQTKPQGKHRSMNTCHVSKYWCNTNKYRHPRLHDDTGITTGNVTRWTPTIF